MGWFSDFFSNPIETLGETGQKVIDTVKEKPVESALLATGAYYGYGALAASAEGGAAALAPVSDAIAVPVSEIAGTGYVDLGVSNAGYGALEFGAGGPSVGSIATTATTAVTAKDILSGVNSGLNLATAGVKLAGLQQLTSSTGKMNSTLPASGIPSASTLGGLIGPSNINTPEVQATTPAGAVLTPTAQASAANQNQNMMVLAAAAVGLFLLWKYKGA